jgi:thioesterase domain-containing protein
MVNGDVFGDGALYCLELAQRLGPEQPFYSLSSHGTNGGPIPPTIQLMAADHVMTLRASVPGASYLLGGFSHGGLVAFEMARQLTAFGCRVPLVVIIDMPPSQPVRQTPPKLRAPSRGPRLHAALRTLGRVARHHVTRLTQTSMERLVPAVRAVAEPDDSPARADVRHTPAWRRRQWVTYGRIVREYNPGWYPGSVTVMIARDGHYAGAMPDDALGWRTVAGRVRTISIPGDHVTAVTKHTATIARHLDRCLAEIYG